MRTLTEKQLIKLLRDRIAEHGTMRKASFAWDTTESNLGYALSGKRIGPKVLKILGAKKKIRYEVEDAEV